MPQHVGLIPHIVAKGAVIHFRTGVKYYNVLGAFQDRWSDRLRHYSSAMSKKDSEFSYAHK